MFVLDTQSPAWPHSLGSPTVSPECPPVSLWLDHSGPVCQLVDICLLPPPSVVMATNPPPPPHPLTIAILSSPLPSPGWPALSTPLSCFPLTPAVNHLCLSCSPPRLDTSTDTAQHSTLSETVTVLCCVCWFADPETPYLNVHTDTGHVS